MKKSHWPRPRPRGSRIFHLFRRYINKSLRGNRKKLASAFFIGNAVEYRTRVSATRVWSSHLSSEECFQGLHKWPRTLFLPPYRRFPVPHVVSPRFPISRISFYLTFAHSSCRVSRRFLRRKTRGGKAEQVSPGAASGTRFSACTSVNEQSPALSLPPTGQVELRLGWQRESRAINEVLQLLRTHVRISTPVSSEAEERL